MNEFTIVWALGGFFIGMIGYTVISCVIINIKHKRRMKELRDAHCELRDYK